MFPVFFLTSIHNFPETQSLVTWNSFSEFFGVTLCGRWRVFVKLKVEVEVQDLLIVDYDFLNDCQTSIESTLI